MLDGLCHFPKEIIPNCMPLLLTNLYVIEFDVSVLIDFQTYQKKKKCVWRQKEFRFRCFLGHNISHLLFLSKYRQLLACSALAHAGALHQAHPLHAAEDSGGLTLHPPTSFLYPLKTCAQMVAFHSLSKAALSSGAKIKYIY